MPDPHGDDTGYRITSQYYDAPDMACYWSKINGEGRRKKIRTRYYGIPESIEALDSQTAYIEIKHRIRSCVFKERTKMAGNFARKLLANPSLLRELSSQPFADQTSATLLSKIEKLSRQSQLQAANIITYNRSAWLGTNNHRLRVTFDSNIESFPPSQYLPKFGSGQSLLKKHLCVLEIKFNRVMPTWVKDCIVISNAQMQRFSKYAHGLEALGVVSDQTTD